MTSRAWVSGVLGMRIRPPKGVCSSVIIRIAVPIPTAQRNIMASAVILRGANRPKLTKMIMNQNMTSSSKGKGIPLALSCCSSCQRAAIIVPMRFSACGCSQRCVAFVGVRARTLSCTNVTNPLSRIAPVTANNFATLNLLAPGRAIMGIGTGNTARRTLGMPATKLSELREHVDICRGLLGGQTVPYEEAADGG